MENKALQSHDVWDAPTRLFHWTNFVCFLALAAIGTVILYSKPLGISSDGKVLLKTIHVWFGYIFTVNLVLRIAWMFVGNRYARWFALLPFRKGYWTEFLAYLRGFSCSDVRPYLGHNPVARVIVFLLIIMLVIQALTGLVLAGTDIYYPPFGHWIAAWIAAPGSDPSSIVPYDKTGVDPVSWEAMRSFRSPVLTVHYWGFYALLVAVIIHIAGVVTVELRERNSIVSAMIAGRKVLDQKPVDCPDISK